MEQIQVIEQKTTDFCISFDQLKTIQSYTFVTYGTRDKKESKDFLLRLLSHLYSRPITTADLIDGENQKPKLLPTIEPPLFFNISHTDHATAVIVSLKHEVGVDIELVREVKMLPMLVTRYFTVSESQWICETKDTDEQHRRFFELWTQKEAAIKAQSSTMLKGLKNILNSEQKRLMKSETLTNGKSTYAITWCCLI